MKDHRPHPVYPPYLSPMQYEALAFRWLMRRDPKSVLVLIRSEISDDGTLHFGGSCKYMDGREFNKEPPIQVDHTAAAVIGHVVAWIRATVDPAWGLKEQQDFDLLSAISGRNPDQKKPSP